METHVRLVKTDQCASTHSDRSIYCRPVQILDTWLSTERQVKTLNKAHVDAGRSKSPLGAYVIRYTLAASSEKSAIESEQIVRLHITLHMRKVLSGHLLSVETF